MAAWWRRPKTPLPPSPLNGVRPSRISPTNSFSSGCGTRVAATPLRPTQPLQWRGLLRFGLADNPKHPLGQFSCHSRRSNRQLQYANTIDPFTTLLDTAVVIDSHLREFLCPHPDNQRFS